MKLSNSGMGISAVALCFVLLFAVVPFSGCIDSGTKVGSNSDLLQTDNVSENEIAGFTSEKIYLEDRVFDGFFISLDPSPLLMIRTQDNGVLMCGYLDMATAEKVGMSAAKVSGVASFDDMLHAKVTAVSPKAAEKGVVEGMTGEEALKLL